MALPSPLVVDAPSPVPTHFYVIAGVPNQLLFGMIVSAIGFFLLNTLSADFSYWPFAFYIFLVGAGQGIFSSPNSAAIVNSVPSRYRGAASGMRSTFQNSGMMLSMGIFFTIVIGSLSTHLPTAMSHGLSSFGLPHPLVHRMDQLPPISALFSALLGYNPLQTIIPASVMHTLPAAVHAHLISRSFFPTLIGPPFMKALRVVFLFSVIISLIAAIASLFRGKARYVVDDDRDAN